ncbi:hypothetical protein ACSETL_32560, partial [Pseudomonas aeruginosa]
MPSSKRDHARIERRLIASLTDACEAAKAEIVGFDWLTHEANYQAFPQSLRVIWVGDSTRTWTPIPRTLGQRLHADLDTHSTATWTLIPQ